MHAHTFATQERTLAPSQMLRGVATTYALVEGTSAPSFALCSPCPAPRRGGRKDIVDSYFSARSGGLKWSKDFGDLVGGGPV